MAVSACSSSIAIVGLPAKLRSPTGTCVRGAAAVPAGCAAGDEHFPNRPVKEVIMTHISTITAAVGTQ
jgi:hypothetical protein